MARARSMRGEVNATLASPCCGPVQLLSTVPSVSLGPQLCVPGEMALPLARPLLCPQVHSTAAQHSIA